MNKYLNERETAIVVDLIAKARPSVVFEFGVNRGHTAKAILAAVPTITRYIGIDVPFGFRTSLNCQLSEVPLNAGAYAAADKRFALLTCDQGSSTLTADDLEPADAIFIDGDHSAPGVLADSLLARAILRSGGIIVWHDYNNPAVEVTGVLDNFIIEGWPIHHVKDTWLAYMQT